MQNWVPRGSAIGSTWWHLSWIVAVCINHKDEVERSEQVKQMREIYAKANRTVA
ncbi:uncharacterized protein BDZ99DRAFT_385339 [Mytilinidion resinicola]|uniref:Heterokaryon incompatibility domain-containing protein n=1 Tax=Mytilinidion resinicola TaxID=574789 RepID=A0A6A6YS62_9PEZI|nr:uncharacterized protein BDZ99DRAFT_385339 [Mytilinidion resinicola]KAF2810805.1 hypothetical protein BDZ99DRAFT_385339 [Mytilinidion resinicola]